MRRYRPGAHILIASAIVLGGIAQLLVAAMLHSPWWLLVALAALAAWLVLMWFDARVWRKRQEDLVPCPLCGRTIVDGEAQTNGMHHLCLWATTVGHYHGLCGCTGWNDPYLAGLEGERRAQEGPK